MWEMCSSARKDTIVLWESEGKVVNRANPVILNVEVLGACLMIDFSCKDTTQASTYENHTSKKWFISNSNLMDHWVFVGVTNRNIGDGYLWEQKWFKSSCITEKPNPTGTMTDESWNPGALCTTCTQLDSLEISSLEFSWSESLPAGRETMGDCCCSPRHTIFSLLLSLLGLPIPCWGDIRILRKLLNTSKKTLLRQDNVWQRGFLTWSSQVGYPRKCEEKA